MNEKNMLFYIKYKINDTNNFKYESNELLKLNNKYVKSSSLMKSIVWIAIWYLNIAEYQLCIAVFVWYESVFKFYWFLKFYMISKFKM